MRVRKVENEAQRPRNHSQRLQNEAQRPSKSLPEASWRPKGALGALWGWFWGLHGHLQGAPELSWGPLGGVLGGFGRLLGNFVDVFLKKNGVRGGLRRENSDILENDYLTAHLLCFRGPKGSKMSS